jgi:hypothetical protein
MRLIRKERFHLVHLSNQSVSGNSITRKTSNIINREIEWISKKTVRMARRNDAYFL